MPAYPGVAGSTTISPIVPTSMVVGDSVLLFNAETITAPEASIAVTPIWEAGRPAPAFVFELLFSGAPGAFSLQLQEADTDADAYYINPTNTAYTISAVSANQVARTDLIPFGGSKIRAYFASLANAVKATLKVTRVA